MSTEHPRRIDCVLIAGGKYHDIDFARLELLKLLAEDSRVRVRVFEDDVEVYSHAALVGTRLYLRGGSSIVCIDLGNG